MRILNLSGCDGAVLASLSSGVSLKLALGNSFNREVVDAVAPGIHVQVTGRGRFYCAQCAPHCTVALKS